MPIIVDSLVAERPRTSTLRGKALRLDMDKLNHLDEAADLIKNGGVLAVAFNGIYGLFGDVENIEAANRIFTIKDRNKAQNLVIVSPPEDAHSFIDLNKTPHDYNKLVQLWKDIHALGVILPASESAPNHLVKPSLNTLVVIWTEYAPMRRLFERLKLKGIKALVGTSANRAGQPTHNSAIEVWEDFKLDVDAVLEADFDNIPSSRRKSTTLIDLTEHTPRLNRIGNVPQEELETKLKKHAFPKIQISANVKSVKVKK